MKVVYNQKYMKKGVWKDEIKTKIPECGYFEITDVLFMGGAGILVKLDAGIHSTWELNLNWLEPYTEENQ